MIALRSRVPPTLGFMYATRGRQATVKFEILSSQRRFRSGDGADAVYPGGRRSNRVGEKVSGRKGEEKRCQVPFFHFPAE